MMSAFLLLLLKILALAAAGVFAACVLAVLVCCALLLFQLARGAGSSSPFAAFTHYRAIKSADQLPSAVACVESYMHRAQRIAIRAWLVALVAGLSMIIVALVSGQR